MNKREEDKNMTEKKTREGSLERKEPSYMDSVYKAEGCLGEAAPKYLTDAEENRKYTIEDYYAFEDDIRRELIDGKFYVMEAPSVKHQVILGELFVLFRECAELHDHKCRVLFSPCDVQLDRDMYTMVQPDLFIVCDREEDLDRCVHGAPDLAVEIMSPSSRSRDSVLKLNKYMRAGVREYWLVDPQNETVLVYLRDENGNGEGRYHTYSFKDRIPVAISDGMCEVDFSVVARAIGT